MTDSRNPGKEINLDERVVRPRDFYYLLRNRSTCLNLSFVRFTFRILILFGFVNSSNFTWVIIGLEKCCLSTRRDIHGWLKNIAVKLEKEKKTNLSLTEDLVSALHIVLVQKLVNILMWFVNRVLVDC